MTTTVELHPLKAEAIRLSVLLRALTLTKEVFGAEHGFHWEVITERSASAIFGWTLTIRAWSEVHPQRLGSTYELLVKDESGEDPLSWLDDDGYLDASSLDENLRGFLYEVMDPPSVRARRWRR